MAGASCAWLIAATLLLVSAGWLQLSAASQEGFTLTPPSSAKSPPRITSEDQADGNGSLESVPIETRETLETNVLTLENDASAAVPDSAPPSLRNVPIPTELNSDTLPIIDTGSPESLPTGASASEASNDPSLRISDEIEFRLEDPDAIDPLIAEPIIAPHVIRVLGQREGMDLLADPRQRYEDGVLLSSSFSEAIDLAEKYGANRIEIATPFIYSEPVAIKSDGLLITSTIAGGSVVAFKPKDLATLQRSSMLAIGSSRIEMDDLHFVWNVSPGLIEGGALIRVNDNRLIRMTDCSMTINNPASVDEVYAFDVVTDPEAIDWTDRDQLPRGGNSLPLVAIELNNVIVRGQMTMVHMDCATELQLQWDNGLLAISERMIDTAGARLEPPLTSGPIQLSLTRLTAQRSPWSATDAVGSQRTVPACD